MGGSAFGTGPSRQVGWNSNSFLYNIEYHSSHLVYTLLLHHRKIKFTTALEAQKMSKLIIGLNKMLIVLLQTITFI